MNDNENFVDEENEEHFVNEENEKSANDDSVIESETQNQTENENLQNENGEETDENDNRQHRQNEKNPNKNEIPQREDSPQNEISPNDNEISPDGNEAPQRENHSENEGDDGPKATMNQKYGPRRNKHGLCPRKPHDYSHLHMTLEGTAMTQHSIKRWLKVFGKAGTHAVLQELKQLHDRKLVEPPKRFHDLSCKERGDSLRYLMFLKEKCYGLIKGRGCANGHKQREYLTKEEMSSPTVAIESVMLS
jgi:hypothetical protein